MLDLSLNAFAPPAPWAGPAGPYFGKPFRAFARGPDAFDCWGLVQAVREAEFGDTLKSYSDAYESTRFAEADRLDALLRAEAAHFRVVTKVVVGDLLLLALYGKACHVGLASGAGGVLHCRDGRDGRAAAGVVNEPIEPTPEGFRVGAFRIVGAYAPQ